MQGSKLILGIDLGATNVRVGLIQLSTGQLIASKQKELNKKEPSDVVGTIADLVRLVLFTHVGGGWSGVEQNIGLAAPGRINGRIVVVSSNFHGWENVPMSKLLEEELGNDRHVILVNDADAALMAEAKYGYGKEHPDDSFCLLTLGTGVGSGLYLNGRPYKGPRGCVEVGHMIVEHDVHSALPCSCGQKGCLEAYSSATGITNAVHRALSKGPGDDWSSEEASSNSALRMDSSAADVFGAAAKGDKLASAIVEEACERLGVGCLNLARILDLDAILLAGGVAAGDGLVNLVQSTFSQRNWTLLPQACSIQLSELPSGTTGMIGAAVSAASSS